MSTIFEPRLSLSRERDGEYTLHAVTITPNGCFSAGPAERHTPPTRAVAFPDDVETVLLHLRTRGEVCHWVPRAVQHCLPDLKIGKEHGKTKLTAVVMLGDSRLGSSTIDVTRELGDLRIGEHVKDTPAPIETSDWYAWVDAAPCAPRVLHVQGVITMPSPGYDAALVPVVPQGFNPKVLLTRLEIKRRRGVFPGVVTRIPVRFELPDAIGYESVHVHIPGGDGLLLDVDKAG